LRIFVGGLAAFWKSLNFSAANYEGDMSKFQKGNTANRSGRPEGVRSRFAARFLQDLLKEWTEHGAAVLRIARIERPLEFAKLAASCLPKELVFNENGLADMSDEDLEAALATLKALRDAGISKLSVEPEPTQH
jgi:hypothetical protein